MAEYNSVIPLLLQTLEKPTHCRGMVAVERWAERADEYSAGLEEEIKKGQEEAAKLTEKIEKLRSEKLDVYDLGYSGHSYHYHSAAHYGSAFAPHGNKIEFAPVMLKQ